jgi:hypothetical protein
MILHFRGEDFWTPVFTGVTVFVMSLILEGVVFEKKYFHILFGRCGRNCTGSDNKIGYYREICYA